jgi:hypothetical protein
LFYAAFQGPSTRLQGRSGATSADEQLSLDLAMLFPRRLAPVIPAASGSICPHYAHDAATSRTEVAV